MDIQLIDKDQVAKLVGCHPRHVYRMVEAGQMPKPMKIGKLLRWSYQTIEEWIASGCPSQKETV